MVKKVQLVKLPTKIYRVVGNANKMLGPHKIFFQGQNKVVALNEKQAKYYLTTGAIEEA